MPESEATKEPELSVPKAILLLALVAAGVYLWPGERINAGYEAFNIYNPYVKRRQDIKVIKGYAGTAALILRGPDGYRQGSFTQNGYNELALDMWGHWVIHEKLTGLMPAILASANDRALVSGFGTGVTTSGAVAGFDQVMVTEINDATLIAGRRWFAEENGHVLAADNLQVLRMDGIVALGRQALASLDAIIMGSTTPAFAAAGKLWSTAWLHLVASRLRTGGVFSTYVDSSFTGAGVMRYLHDLHAIFGRCIYVPYATAYVEVLCAKGAFNPRPAGAIDLPEAGDTDVIAEQLGVEKRALPGFLRAMAYPADAPPGGFWRASLRVNSLDHPLLSRVASRRRSAVRYAPNMPAISRETGVQWLVWHTIHDAPPDAKRAIQRYVGALGIRHMDIALSNKKETANDRGR